VKPKFRGEKLGEQLLKQVLWFAQRNRYDLAYVTTFSEQTTLIGLLEYFGFEMTVPIRGEYHNILFPEMATKAQPDLFQLAGLALEGGGPRTPGNTIRKVYLCRARSKALTPGDTLLFYRSSSRGYVASQCATSIGIVEEVNEASDLDALLRLTAKRSVYSTEQLNEILAASSEPVKVIDFLLVGHLEPPVPLKTLVSEQIFTSGPPQSISQLSPERFEAIRRRMNFGFEV
jgi:hypothetical protein